MNQDAFQAGDSLEIGRQICSLAERLYPICRSVTGNGIRDTFRILKEYVPFEIEEVPSGKAVFDWTVPNEWNIEDAWVKNPRGEKIVDFKQCNLHILQYSVPIARRMPLSELKEHLFTLPDRPDWIPYRTSFFRETWGFCMSHAQLLKLEEGDYEVRIDSTLKPGHLTYGEYFVPGQEEDEVLIYSHVCHPSLANDNLSGIGILTCLAEHLSRQIPRLSFRFVLAPSAVGAISWLAANENRVPRIRHGLVLACLGGPGDFHYKKSRRGNAEVDRAVQMVLRESGEPFHIREFSPYGYSERQFCSPGFNLPVGCLMRTPHGEYPEYHTSADNLSYIRPEFLADSWTKLLRVLDVLDNNRIYLNQKPKCEPQLGKRGLYGSVGGETSKKDWEMALLWLLNLSDGSHSLLDIAERSQVSYALLKKAARELDTVGLLQAASNHKATVSV